MNNDNFKETINIPSSFFITSTLNLEFKGEAAESNPAAAFGFSVPVITDECPGKLQYFPLSKNSHYSLKKEVNQDLFMQAMSNKNFCVIICNSIDIEHEESKKKRSFKSRDKGPLAFIAGVWDVTEDPLMAATLFSCTLLSMESEPDGGRIPLLLTANQINSWISGSLDLKQRLQFIQSLKS
ncbi:hypothetical protein [Desertivirga xinjiangensis]|uniref:hypothetical protein n=1 Tax=Desertivirga xinjiangensis TaxID=539206 RepID=UPI00210F0824|nr:hypothetical protein [Pedobacter xinjiangensis]